MIIEHPSHPDSPWLILNSVSEFVAVADWREWVKVEGRPERLSCVRLLAGESNDRAEVEAWARQQLAGGAAGVLLYRTWLIKEEYAPKGHRLHSKRDNSFIGGIRP